MKAYWAISPDQSHADMSFSMLVVEGTSRWPACPDVMHVSTCTHGAPSFLGNAVRTVRKKCWWGVPGATVGSGDYLLNKNRY